MSRIFCRAFNCLASAASTFLLCALVASCSSFRAPGEQALRNRNLMAEYFSIASSYEEQKNYSKAIEYYKKVLKDKELHESAYYKVGYCHAKAGNWAEALKIYKQLLQKD